MKRKREGEDFPSVGEIGWKKVRSNKLLRQEAWDSRSLRNRRMREKKKESALSLLVGEDGKRLRSHSFHALDLHRGGKSMRRARAS